MKQVITFLLAILLLSASIASAQTTFRLGVRGGAHRASTTLDEAGNFGSFSLSSSADKSAIYSWQAGIVLEASLGKVALQPALIFSQKGERFITSTSAVGIIGNSTSQTTSTNRYNWLELPLNVVYTLYGNHGLQFFAGPYVALAVGGRQQGVATYSSPFIYAPPQNFDNHLTYGTSTNNRRLDAGVNVGIGYRQGPVQVQASYGLGLRNLHQPTPTDEYDPGFSPNYHNFNADAAYNRVAQLTGTYFFAL